MLTIAKNAAEYIDSLFHPIDGRTYDGHIVKVKKNSIDLWIRGKDYTLNAYNVLAVRSKGADGKTWYHYQVDDLFGSRTTEREWGETMLAEHGIKRRHENWA